MKRWIVLASTAALLLAGLSLVSAQEFCGNGLPCGKLPWPIPGLPELYSPTPMPTIPVTLNATQVSGAVPTPPAVPTNPPLATVDTAQISAQVQTLQAVMAQTPMIVLDLDGTPVDTSETFDTLGGNAQTFFGYAKSITTDQFGALSPLFSFTFVAFLTVASISSITFILPFATAAFGFIRKIIQLILDFLPF